MTPDPNAKPDPLEDTGTADVRRVREKIAAQYNGDIRRHADDTDRIVEPLLAKLGLKEGTPSRRVARRSGTEG
jgi:hypothetical protein